MDLCLILGNHLKMDLLEDILKHSGLKSRIIAQRTFSSPVSMKFPCSKSIGFHVVVHGQAFIHQKSKDKIITLKKGDIALMARGKHHVVSTENEITDDCVEVFDFDLPKSKGREKLKIVSGAYQLWNRPVHPFFSEIPDWFIMRSEEIQNFDKLQLMINLLSEEMTNPELGSERVVQGILDIMFAFIVRKIVQQTSLRSQSWGRAIQDVEIKFALDLLHGDIAHAWSLEEIAKKVGISRAGLALKFKKTMGDTPLHYLTTLRIQKSMDLLSSTDMRLEEIAREIGYQDAFGFSKAFKKIVGSSPRDFRLKDLEEQKTGLRI